MTIQQPVLAYYIYFLSLSALFQIGLQISNSYQLSLNHSYIFTVVLFVILSIYKYSDDICHSYKIHEVASSFLYVFKPCSHTSASLLTAYVLL